MTQKKIEIIKLAEEIIQEFPQNKNQQKYLKNKENKKIFLHIFLSKYTKSNKYNYEDLKRRFQFLESFPCLIKRGDLKFQEEKNGQKYYIIQTKFFRFIIVKNLRTKQLFLLSFYPRTQKNPPSVQNFPSALSEEGHPSS